jgi:hypothetical protein
MATPSATCNTPVQAKRRKSQLRLGQGIRVETQGKLMVRNVFKYFEEQRKMNPKNPGSSTFEKTIKATGLVFLIIFKCS